jgi:cytochrome c biogenesis protein
MMRRLWDYCCSLKLAIYLASAVTLLLMGGSLLIPSHGRIFGPMDQLPAGAWMKQIAAANLEKTWWFYLAAILIVLFGLNTLCCFIDWLFQFRSRWRKTGEYLLHLGVCLVLVAYFWGAACGWRHNSMQFPIGETVLLPESPGYSLRVDDFKPVMSETGPPRDMISTISLWHKEQLLASGKVQINQPLLQDGIVITPVSFGQAPVGFRAFLPGQPNVQLRPGSRIMLPAGKQLEILRFLPDARRQPNGEIFYRSNQLGNPAFQLRFRTADGFSWQGWYLAREPLPQALLQQGLRIRLLAPIYSSYSSLTVNYDPGARLAAIGSLLMTVGVFVAMISFYRKRKHQDRPEI